MYFSLCMLQAVEEELEELRKSAASWAGGGAPNDVGGEPLDAAAFEKKLAKLRKKYDKKILTLKQENDDIREVCSFVRLFVRLFIRLFVCSFVRLFCWCYFRSKPYF